MKKDVSSHPMISVVTRACNRPQKLARNRQSLQYQTDPDFEQFIIDNSGQPVGYLSANTQIYKISDQLNGQYVYILDDDDFIVNDNFIKDFKYLVASQLFPPAVVICKGHIDSKCFPKVWSAQLNRGQIGSPNFIVRNDIFEFHALHWIQARAGDFHFIKSCQEKETFFWWDKIIFEAE
jgi:hypothetical protein